MNIQPLRAWLTLASGLALAGCSQQHPGSNSASARPGQGREYLGFYVPDYPGAGLSGADKPLEGGKVCDEVPASSKKLKKPNTACFFAPGQTQPAATIEQVLECAEETDAVHLRLTFDPRFVDNTYGANAIGWIGRGGPGGPGGPGAPPPPQGPGAAAGGMAPPPPPPADPGKAPGMAKGPGKAGHTWKDLVGSDHAELSATDTTGKTIIRFKLDYISASSAVPSGYKTLGASGGDGKMISGNVKDLVKFMTSIDRNLNERGYVDYFVDSPATDENYTPNPAAPNWDYRVVYEAWIDIKAFGDAGFGDASIEFVHASPSKGDNDTLKVKRDKCPCQDPKGCDNRCVVNPDDFGCADASIPDNDKDKRCVVNPDDFGCTDASLPDPPPDAGVLECVKHPEAPGCTAQ